MKMTGSVAFERLWGYLECESPRGLVVVIAAHFDELLKDPTGLPRSDFNSRIERALAVGLLTLAEHDDLHSIRKLRNLFAHHLEHKDFDAEKSQTVNRLKTWVTISEAIPAYEAILPTPRERLVYVAAALTARLARRTARVAEPLPEPEVWDTDSWPPLVSR